MVMQNKLRILVLVDTEHSFQEIHNHLKKSVYPIEVQKIQSIAQLSPSLRGVLWDTVIVVHNKGGIDGLEALKIVREFHQSLPFILLPGQHEEDVAVKVLRLGANDCISLHNLTRLAAVVERETYAFEHRELHEIAEKKVLQSSIRFKSMFELHRSVMLMVEVEHGYIIDANDAALMYYGYPYQEICEKNFIDITYRPPVDLLDILIRQDEGMKPVLLMQRLFDGRITYVEVFATVIEYDYSKVIYMIIHDVTSRIQASRDLNEALATLKVRNEELDNFIYKVSHDVRAPVCSIKGLLNLMHIDTDEEKKGEYLAMIENRIDKLDRFILDVLSHAKNLNHQAKYEPIQLDELILSIYDSLKYLPHTAKVSLAVHVDRSFVFYSDRIRLEMIFKNLMANAIQYINLAECNHTIEIHAQHRPGNMKIVFSDNGIGIEENILSQIFDMFFRGTERSEGAGIGLYIVKRAVEKLKGQISVSSTPGKGTIFTIDLPNKQPVIRD